MAAKTVEVGFHWRRSLVVVGAVRALSTYRKSKIGVVSEVDHKLDGIGVGRIRTVPFSSYGAYDSDADDPVKTRLSESQAEANLPITMPISAYDSDSDNLDSKLSFSKHISHICERVNNQSRVIGRFGNLLSGSIRLRLYKAFVQPIFQYCSAVWHFCGARNSNNLELVNKRALRLVLKDRSSSYSALLSRLDMVPLRDKRVQDILTMVYKGLYNMAPGYITSLFKERSLSAYHLRGKRKLQVPAVRTTAFGLHSFKYLAVLSDELRMSDTLAAFKRGIRSYISSVD